MTKRRTFNAQRKRLRDRRSGKSPYAKYAKVPYKYRWSTADRVDPAAPRPPQTPLVPPLVLGALYEHGGDA